MKTSSTIISLILTLLCASGCKRVTGESWNYQYRDEGGNIVFVTQRFDLVLVGRNWQEDGRSFSGGNGVLTVKQPAFATITMEDSRLNPTFGDEGLELSFPNLSLSIVNGDTVKILSEVIPLNANERILILVKDDDSVTVSQSPSSNHKWRSIEYIRELAENIGSNKSP